MNENIQINEKAISEAATIMIGSFVNNGFLETLNAVFGRNFRVRLPFSRAVLDTSIDDVGFTNRIKNAFHRSSVFTVGDVLALIEESDVSGIKNLGKKSDREIKTCLLLLSWDGLSPDERAEFCKELFRLNVGKFADEA